MNGDFFQLMSIAHFRSLDAKMKSQWELPQEPQVEAPPRYVRWSVALRKAERRVGIMLMRIGGKLVAFGSRYSDAHQRTGQQPQFNE